MEYFEYSSMSMVYSGLDKMGIAFFHLDYLHKIVFLAVFKNIMSLLLN
jgi:hypothetical protein